MAFALRPIAAIAFTLSLTIAALAADKKLNVLFIAFDDLRPELGAYGNKLVKSPNFDKLAERSVTFDRAYCQFPLCNPSRASLLTGKRPETTGIYDLKTNVRDKFPDILTLPQHFKDNGYRALSFGKIFHTGNGNHNDPKSWSEKPWSASDAITSETMPWKKKAVDDDEDPAAGKQPFETPDVADNALVDGQVARQAVKAMNENKDKPFFLAVGFHKPHMPFVAPKKYWDQYDHSAIKLAEYQQDPEGAPTFASNRASELRRYKGVSKTEPIAEDLQRNLIHAYLGCISYVDAQMGLVLDELDKLGLRDNTIIVVWGDHGYQLGEHGTWNKRTTWEIAARVPLLISLPGAAGNGKHTDALTEFVDLFPTLTDVCGLQTPKDLEGISLKPVLEQPDRAWKSAASTVYVSNVPELGGKAIARAIRVKRYRFIQWSALNGKDSDKKVFELYDEVNDPLEKVNLATKPEHAKLVKRLSRKVDAGWKAALPKAGEGDSAQKKPGKKKKAKAE